MIALLTRIGGAGLGSSPLRLALLTLAIANGILGAAYAYDGARIKAKAVIAQALLEKSWRKTLAGEDAVKPWPWADTWPVLKIEAPRHNKSDIVLHSVSGQAMAFGPGLMADGRTPGENGLAIIGGHRETHFRFLQQVKIGDEIIVTSPDRGRLVFKVSETQVMNAFHSGLSFDADRPRLALVTCWPFDAVRRGDERFVVFADLASSSKE